MALKLRARSAQARRWLMQLPCSFGLTNGILPYLAAPVSFKRVLGSHPGVPNPYHIGASSIGIGGNRKSSSLPESAGSVMRNVCDTYPITAAQI